MALTVVIPDLKLQNIMSMIEVVSLIVKGDWAKTWKSLKIFCHESSFKVLLKQYAHKIK